jgi:hypothetical protein
VEWHHKRAEALEREWRWDAAAWHLARLGEAAGPEDRRRLAIIRSFVRTWRFAPEVRPWKGAESRTLDAMDPETLKKIAGSCRVSPPSRGLGPRIDFVVRYPEQGSLVMGYVLRAIRCDEARKVRLLAGADDTLRIWLNRREVFTSAELGPAIPDYSQVDVDLVTGENEILVEVGQSGGDWALFFRLEDPDGRWLHLDDDGRLERIAESGPSGL